MEDVTLISIYNCTPMSCLELTSYLPYYILLKEEQIIPTNRYYIVRIEACKFVIRRCVPKWKGTMSVLWKVLDH